MAGVGEVPPVPGSCLVPTIRLPGRGGGKPGAPMRAKLTSPCPIELDMPPSLPALSARLGEVA